MRAIVHLVVGDAITDAIDADSGLVRAIDAAELVNVIVLGVEFSRGECLAIMPPRNVAEKPNIKPVFTNFLLVILLDTKSSTSSSNLRFFDIISRAKHLS